MADKSYVFGLHAVERTLDRRAGDIKVAWCLDLTANDRLVSLRARLADRGIEVKTAPRPELDRLADGGRHQGVVIDVPPMQAVGMAELEVLAMERGQSLRLLVLDQVEDPRNLGACLRTADAAAVDCVIVPKARSARLTPSAVKAATGAAETVPVAIVPNLARTLRWLKAAGVWVVGADGTAARPLHDTVLAPPIAVVLGAEGTGLRRLTRESCDEIVRIPLFGSVESLNVSVAAGVLLFELARQAPPGS